MVRFILGFIVAILLAFGGAYIYFTKGIAPSAATANPMPFEVYFAHAALHAKLSQDAPKTVPIQGTPENLLAGAKTYKTHCAFCHGLPNSKPSVPGSGMYPPAPQLFSAQGNVATDPPGWTYWKVDNGIRVTGMPSFKKVLNSQQIWQVALLLHNAENLSPLVAAELTAAPPAPAPAASATPAKKAAPTKPKGH